MQIFAEFESHGALIREFENNLSKARAFVRGEWDVSERQICEVVLIHPVSGEWMPLKAEVVYLAPPESPAVGLEILDWGSEKAALVSDFVDLPEGNPLSLVSPDSLAAERFELDSATPHVTIEKASQRPAARGAPAEPELDLSAPSPAPSSESGSEAMSAPETLEAPPLTEEAPLESEPPPDTEAEPSSRRSQPPPKNVQERVRKLNMRERDAMARGGTLTERVALERAYGAAVWDALLSNAGLTPPEVARIAKNGNVTAPHLNIIVGNPAWLSKSLVRRALLTNPRLSPPQIDRVLRALPPAELKLLPKQTAYSPKVRSAASRMIPR